MTWDLDDTQVVIFGHTHKYFEKIIDDRLWLNPGSRGRSRFGGEVTMAVMTVEDGRYQVEKIILTENSEKMIRTLFTDPFMQRCFRKLLEYADV